MIILPYGKINITIVKEIDAGLYEVEVDIGENKFKGTYDNEDDNDNVCIRVECGIINKIDKILKKLKISYYVESSPRFNVKSNYITIFSKFLIIQHKN